jgi:hypothetical protein
MGNFYTDIISKSSHFNDTKRIADIDLLEPKTRELVQAIVQGAKAGGVPVMIFETFRSQARQQLLFDQKATTLKTVGVHHYGLACDIVRDLDGEPSWKGEFSFLGELAHMHGMLWGGDWGVPGYKHSFVDPDHVQRVKLGRQPALFSGAWYPDNDYDPYQDGAS